MNRYQIQKLIMGAVSGALKILVCLFFAFPFYWMIATSFKTYTESILYPPTLWPQNFTLEGYRTVFEGLDIGMYLKNSVIIILCIVAIQIVVMVPAAYAFARYDFKGNALLFGIVTVAFMVPSQVTFVSIYIMFSNLGLMRTLLPQILPFGANAFGIFLLRQTFKQVPDELIESARLDNASEWRIMTHLMIPMAKPIVIYQLMSAFMGPWGDYIFPSLLLGDKQASYTVAIGLKWLTDQQRIETYYTQFAAGAVLVSVPIVILFSMLQRYYVEGMSGAVKG